MPSNLRKPLLVLLLPLLCVALPSAARAEDGAWRHTVVLYGMGAAIDGSAGIGDVEVEVDVSMSELFDALEMGAMAAYRAENGTWSVTLDATFMGLGATREGPGGRIEGDLDLDQTTLMATAGRRLGEDFELLFGAAYMDLSTRLAVQGPIAVRVAEDDVDWIDPTVGLAWRRPFAERWRVDLRGDLGGFGVGSDLLVQGLATVRWQATDRVGVGFGYRFIQFDYEEGEGASSQRFDLVEQGPLAGVTFTF